jgi:hypothetical protein
MGIPQFHVDHYSFKKTRMSVVQIEFVAVSSVLMIEAQEWHRN